MLVEPAVTSVAVSALMQAYFGFICFSDEREANLFVTIVGEADPLRWIPGLAFQRSVWLNPRISLIEFSQLNHVLSIRRSIIPYHQYRIRALDQSLKCDGGWGGVLEMGGRDFVHWYSDR